MARAVMGRWSVAPHTGQGRGPGLGMGANVARDRRTPGRTEGMRGQCRPLAHVVGLAGLTSLLDAMACGRPVIMTRNALVDIDIEALGFGIWVPAGDKHALGQAMRRMAEDDELVRVMGLKARAFAEEHYRYEAFAKKVLTSCLEAAGEGQHALES